MKKKIEYKIGGLVEDIDEKRIVTGYFASFDTIDDGKDIFRNGAFSKTLQERGVNGKNRIWHLFEHSNFYPINKPMLIEERPKGLYFQTKIPENEIGNMVYSLYKEGAITEHSVGYMSIKESIDKDDIRTMSEAMLLEGSSVLWGMNENTPTEQVKSLQSKADIMTKIFNTANFKDESFELLNNEILKIKNQIATLSEQLKQPQSQQVKNDLDFMNKIEFNF